MREILGDLTIDKSTFVERICMDVDLNVVFVSNIQSVGDDCWGGSPVLPTVMK